MKRKKLLFNPLFFFLVGFFLLGRPTLFPCTVAVVSGKATKDGRPLMWKNRDTSSLDNKISIFKGKKYSFIGLIDVRDKMRLNVWAGINTEGFAIMNAASGDLAESNMGMRDHGSLMKMALGECATASDFESLLERSSGKSAPALASSMPSEMPVFMKQPTRPMKNLMPMTTE